MQPQPGSRTPQRAEPARKANNSEWQNHPDYQVERFWVNAIHWLTVSGVCQVPPTGPN